jgi:hypothetical protein
LYFFFTKWFFLTFFLDYVKKNSQKKIKITLYSFFTKCLFLLRKKS